MTTGQKDEPLRRDGRQPHPAVRARARARPQRGVRRHAALSEMRLDIMQEAFGRVSAPVEDLADRPHAATGLGDLRRGPDPRGRPRGGPSPRPSACSTPASRGRGCSPAPRPTGPARARRPPTSSPTLDALAAGRRRRRGDAIAAIDAYFAPGGGFFATGYVGSTTDLARGRGRRRRRGSTTPCAADTDGTGRGPARPGARRVVADGAFAGDAAGRSSN